MKAVFAYVDRDCVGPIVAALRKKNAGGLTVVTLGGALWPMTSAGRSHLPELGRASHSDVKLEIICADEDLQNVIPVIRQHANPWSEGTACAYVVAVEATIPLHAEPAPRPVDPRAATSA